MFPETLPRLAQKTLALLDRNKILPEGVYLAGGSALALQIGHRRSVDFDFFTPFLFEIQTVKEKIKNTGLFQEEQETYQTLLGKFNQIKFSLFYYPYPLLKKTKQFSGINLASKEDIATMKLVAITSRGTKKDFIDLYFLAKNFFSLESMFDFYEKKYHRLKQNLLNLLKALQYFDDADESVMPKMIKKVNWYEVKDYFSKEVFRLAKKYL